jgi:methylated-DNA-[protein]-cysteine S-methyltransferase
MLTATTTTSTGLASGTLTTWAGTTRVTASARGVRSIWLPSWRAGAPTSTSDEPAISLPDAVDGEAGRHLRQALTELAEYFMGERRVFTVALDPQGPEFFHRAWAEVARVPYGETRSYGEIARALGDPQASRAVGAANGANPVAPFIPCHRIVASDGRLHGYGPGLPLKQRLLVMEGALPASVEEIPAWTARLSASYGGGALYLGQRGARVYCVPGCARAQREAERPARVFATPTEARDAGFAPCPLCQPSA